MRKPLILVTNDDGVHAPGIIALSKAMKTLGEVDVVVVAPDRERSGVGHALTMHRPVYCDELRDGVYSINGTPTDCVVIAVKKILPRRPDLVISGINRGANLGDDVTYSGTVAAALEGTLLGLPSVAVSLAANSRFSLDLEALDRHYHDAGEVAVYIARLVLERGLPEDTLLNVNVPSRPLSEILGVRITCQGKRTYDNAIQEIKDPHGRIHYWQGGGTPIWTKGTETDIHAVGEGYVSVTPLHLDLTNYDALSIIEDGWAVKGLLS